MSEENPQPAPIPKRRALRVGFVPLLDCAPLVMAQELGLYQRHGLNVVLSRELGWATIRDKIIYGELEAAHAIAGLPVAATLGIGSTACDCLTALVLNLHGNAITLSHELWERGARDGETLRAVIHERSDKKILTFGVVHPLSSHNFLLRDWLSAAGIKAEREVQIAVVPPAQMVTNLKAGHLDGFCVGEPWNSAAVRSRVGWCVAASAELDPGHPEKVLMVRREFEEKRGEEHRALVAALLESCRFCDAPENHERVAATLARPQYVGASASDLLHGLSGDFDFGHDVVRPISNFNVFHRGDANVPSSDKAAWVLQRFRAHHLCQDDSALNPALGRRVFRPDIFEEARNWRGATDYAPQTFAGRNELEGDLLTHSTCSKYSDEC